MQRSLVFVTAFEIFHRAFLFESFSFVVFKEQLVIVFFAEKLRELLSYVLDFELDEVEFVLFLSLIQEVLQKNLKIVEELADFLLENCFAVEMLVESFVFFEINEKFLELGVRL